MVLDNNIIVCTIVQYTVLHRLCLDVSSHII